MAFLAVLRPFFLKGFPPRRYFAALRIMGLIQQKDIAIMESKVVTRESTRRIAKCRDVIRKIPFLQQTLNARYYAALRLTGDGVCAVCQEDHPACSLPCGHAFHPWCIDRWFDYASTCPLCVQDSSKHGIWYYSGLYAPAKLTRYSFHALVAWRLKVRIGAGWHKTNVGAGKMHFRKKKQLIVFESTWCTPRTEAVEIRIKAVTLKLVYSRILSVYLNKTRQARMSVDEAIDLMLAPLGI